MATSFDVLRAGKKVGEAINNNPVTVDTDDQCKTQLEQIKLNLPVPHCTDEINLLDKCIAVVSAKDGDDVVFGPAEILALGKLAERYPSLTKEILACSHHLTESVDCDGDLPDGIFLAAADAHGALAAVLNAALQIGSIENFADEDFEEELSDEE